jgi:hypothetical protein
MNTDKRQLALECATNTALLLNEQTRVIIECAIEVLNEPGHGLKAS